MLHANLHSVALQHGCARRQSCLLVPGVNKDSGLCAGHCSTVQLAVYARRQSLQMTHLLEICSGEALWRTKQVWQTQGVISLETDSSMCRGDCSISQAEGLIGQHSINKGGHNDEARLTGHLGLACGPLSLVSTTLHISLLTKSAMHPMLYMSL